MLSGLLGSGVFGAITGLAGSAITAYTSYKMQKMKNEHELKRIEAETQSMIQEQKAKIKVVEAQTEGEVRKAETEALAKSYEGLSKDLFQESYMKYLTESRWARVWAPALVGLLFALVDVLRRAARPVLTYYLVGASTWLTILVWEAVHNTGGALDAAKATALLDQLVMTILYLTVSSVTWWFCDRRMAKFLMRLRDGNAKIAV